MKNGIVYLVIAGFIFLISIVTYAQIEKNYIGDWRFEAPDAPEGSTIGIVTFEKEKVIMTFEGHGLYPSNWLRIKKDSIIYEVDFDRARVLFSLKVTNEKKMSGKAVWDEGETTIMLTKTETKPVGIKI